MVNHLHNTLVLKIKDALAGIAAHDHYRNGITDIYCLNLKAWMGDQMPAVLRILGEAQGEIDSLWERNTALAEHATELLAPAEKES